jgi:hypothetical protein
VLFCIVFFGYRAVVESNSARRQQTSDGIIAQCEVRGRGHKNYCHYTFPVDDEQYTSVNQAEPGTEFGQIVTVYYDSQNPNVNALEEFSKQSREDRLFVCICLVVLPGAIAFTLWDRAPYRQTSDERNS